jgi:hypothetical protein
MRSVNGGQGTDGADDLVEDLAAKLLRLGVDADELVDLDVEVA